MDAEDVNSLITRALTEKDRSDLDQLGRAQTGGPMRPIVEFLPALKAGTCTAADQLELATQLERLLSLMQMKADAQARIDLLQLIATPKRVFSHAD